MWQPATSCFVNRKTIPPLDYYSVSQKTKRKWNGRLTAYRTLWGVATYEGIKLIDKLPSVEDLRKRLDMVEEELREYKEKKNRLKMKKSMDPIKRPPNNVFFLPGICFGLLA